MVLKLASALDVPLRERNSLLLAAGFAPVFPESPMDGPQLTVVRKALEAILEKQEPFPAVVMNRRWDVLRGNQSAQAFFGFLLGERGRPAQPNVLRMMFHPDLLRPYVTNFAEVAQALLVRVRREAVGGVLDETTRALLAEILAYADLPRDFEQPLLPIVPIRFEKDGRRFDFFSTVTTLGTPQDVTAQEIRLECFFPADDETARQMPL
jgi:hypothetical protein